MKNIRTSIFALSLIVIALSCKKSFLDINQDPNRATGTSVTPDLALAAQLSNSAARNASSYDFLHRYMGYWSASGSFSRNTVEMSYNITNDFGQGIWNGIYYNVSQYRSIGQKSAELNWKFYQGITKIMEAHEMAILVDLYGDVPYTSAFDLTGNIRPAYDKGEEIYKKLLPLIDTGMLLIKSATGNDANIATQDVMFKGNKANWAKFGNTLKLRLLLHTIKVSTFNIPGEVAKIVSEGSGFLGKGLSASVQPGYSPDKPNPFFNAHLFNSVGAESDNYNRANNFSLTLLRDLNDTLRLRRIYRPSKTGAAYKGTDYGADPITANSSDNTSGPGYGLANTASSPMWVMTSVEAMFLVAEATARGYLTGDAKTAYEDAVRESFTYLGLTVANANTYLAQTDPKIAFPVAGTLQDKIAVIAWQKYIGLNGLQANETFTDYRRLGVVQPPLSIAPERGTNQIIRRLLYPTTEYNYNAENVGSQGTITPYSPRVFWDK